MTVKCFTYMIFLKDRKLRTETLCLTTETWRLMSNDFLLKTCSLIFDLCRFTFAFYNWTARQAYVQRFTACKLRTSTRTSSDGSPKLLPISDNVSVVIQGVLAQHFRFFNK